MRVVIGEDEALLREGLVLVLERAGIEVAGSAADADEVVDLVHRHRPDVLVTDIRMPPTHTDDGLRAAVTEDSATDPVARPLASGRNYRRFALAQPQHYGAMFGGRPLPAEGADELLEHAQAAFQG